MLTLHTLQITSVLTAAAENREGKGRSPIVLYDEDWQGEIGCLRCIGAMTQ